MKILVSRPNERSFKESLRGQLVKQVSVGIAGLTHQQIDYFIAYKQFLKYENEFGDIIKVGK